MPRTWRIGGAFVAACCSGCFGGGTPASSLAKPPAFAPKDQAKCGVTKSQARPLIVEWPSADRAALEALARRGLVAVRYQGCEMEVLAQCKLSGNYAYTAITRKRDRVTIRDADELYASVPLGAAKLEGKLQKAGELNVSMTIVGRYEADRAAPASEELGGACGEATHLVSAITAGAFEFFAGADAAVGGEASIAGVGAGAKSSAQRELLNQDGDASSCEGAKPSDATPPAGCGALIRVEVVPIVRTSAAVPPPASASGPPRQTTPGAAPAAPAPATLQAGVVRLHVDSEKPVRVMQRGLENAPPVCESPCDAVVDGRGKRQFYFVGDEVTQSDLFTTGDRAGDVSVQVTPGNKSTRSLGTAGLVVGPIVMGAAFPLVLIPVLGDLRDSDRTGYYIGAAAAGVVGAGLLVTGILLRSGSKTKYEFQTPPAAGAPN